MLKYINVLFLQSREQNRKPVVSASIRVEVTAHDAHAQNSSGSISAIINQSGLYLADTLAENIAIGSDVPKNSLIIQNATDILAYFSDTGNLTLRGTLTQSYATP